MSIARLEPGGHSAAILPLIQPGGTLFGFDLDASAEARVQSKLGQEPLGFRFIHGNFAGLQTRLQGLDIQEVDAVIADLGVSSPQIDDPERGFSYVRPGPLDMRMDPSRGLSLAAQLEKLPVEEIAETLREFGDVQKADEVALAIKTEFTAGQIQNTVDLSKVLARFLPKPPKNPNSAQGKVRPANLFAQVFQAFRILVNREMENLKALLRVVPFLLKPGGIVAIISFHSGEDRLVKSNFSRLFQLGVFQEFSRDPVRTSFQEKIDNPRSRSAKLRWARKGDILPGEAITYPGGKSST